MVIMSRWHAHFLSLLLVLFLSATAFAGYALVDDFNSGNIDQNIWSPWQVHKVVQVLPENQQLSNNSKYLQVAMSDAAGAVFPFIGEIDSKQFVIPSGVTQYSAFVLVDNNNLHDLATIALYDPLVVDNDKNGHFFAGVDVYRDAGDIFSPGIYVPTGIWGLETYLPLLESADANRWYKVVITYEKGSLFYGASVYDGVEVLNNPQVAPLSALADIPIVRPASDTNVPKQVIIQYASRLQYDKNQFAYFAYPTYLAVDDVNFPQIQLVSPDENKILSPSLVDLNFTVQDDFDENVSCELIVLTNGAELAMQQFGVLENIVVSYALSDLNAGVYDWNVSCIDDSNNSAVSQRNFFIDSNKPVMTLLSAVSRNNSSRTIDVNFSALDDFGVEGYFVSTDLNNWTIIDANNDASYNSYSFNVSSNKDYNIYVFASDFADNNSDVNAVSVRVSYTAPSNNNGGGGGGGGGSRGGGGAPLVVRTDTNTVVNDSNKVDSNVISVPLNSVPVVNSQSNSGSDRSVIVGETSASVPLNASTGLFAFQSSTAGALIGVLAIVALIGVYFLRRQNNSPLERI